MNEIIEVVGAAFVKNGKIFAARRSYGSEHVIRKYEFVGGKVESGEEKEQALIRECKEELDLDISVIKFFSESYFDYPDKRVHISVYLCKMIGGYKVKEHEECLFIPLKGIDKSLWAPADRQILAQIEERFAISYAFVTGATGYIGKAFCRELAARGENLFLTGRDCGKLESLKRELHSDYPKIAVEYFACDLTIENCRQELFSAAECYTFSRLVNVAGADVQKAFEKYDQKKIVFQTRILFEAAVSVTRFCLDYASENFSIINISSICGLYPMPYFAVYSALKGALASFSQALIYELKPKGIKVTAILPGAVHTRPDVVEYIKKQGLWGRIAAKSPEYIAKKSLKAGDKGKRKYIPGAANRLMHFFTALLPESLKLKFIARRWSKTQKDAF